MAFLCSNDKYVFMDTRRKIENGFDPLPLGVVQYDGFFELPEEDEWYIDASDEDTRITHLITMTQSQRIKLYDVLKSQIPEIFKNNKVDFSHPVLRQWIKTVIMPNDRHTSITAFCTKTAVYEACARIKMQLTESGLRAPMLTMDLKVHNGYYPNYGFIAEQVADIIKCNSKYDLIAGDPKFILAIIKWVWDHYTFDQEVQDINNVRVLELATGEITEYSLNGVYPELQTLALSVFMQKDVETIIFEEVK